uniref:Dolichol kinase n=1 Tax=Oryza barthii TaxID=65489 RepID=A0A0D3EVV0_9ORYZ
MVSLISAHLLSLPSSAPRSRPQSRPPLSPPAAASCSFDLPRPRRLVADGSRRKGTMAAAIPPEASGLAHDLGSAAVTAGVALALLRFFEELAKRGVFEQKLNRKLVHITIGMVFLLFWPLFSSGSYAPFLAAVAPGINIIRMLLLGLGVMKNEAMLLLLLLQGTSQGSTVLCYHYNFCHFYILENLSNRYSPYLQLMCWGRRLGQEKLPYNPNKSYAGSIAMALAGFMASIGYMHYFQSFGFIEESWSLAFGFLVVSVTAALVESHPISTHLDDNLTVPLTSFLVGSLVF